MKIKAFLLSITVALLLSACGASLFSKSDAGGTSYPGHLQGQIFDAKTGAPIGGDLTVTLIQGSTTRGPDSLVTDTTNPLAGEYTFGNMPVEQAAAGNKFKLVVVKPGYQTFESEFTYAATLGANNGGTGQINYSTYYSMIGNVYLYPTGSIAAPIDVNVVDTFGKAVAGVTVQLRQDIDTNGNNGINPSPNRLAPTNGLLPALTTAVTDAAGKATFAAKDLALGAKYTPVALAITANSLNLDTTAGTAIIVGTSPQVQVLNMANATYGALAVVAQSNPATAAPLASGVLNMVFNQPISVDSGAAYTATVTATTGGPITATVTGVVTGSSLVLTPTFTPAISAATTGVTITYAVTANTAQAYLTTTGVNTTATYRGFINGQVVNVTN